MGFDSGNKVLWEDVFQIYSDLNTERNRFGFTSAAIPNKQGELTENDVVADLKALVEELTTSADIGSVASTSTINVPTRGTYLKGTPFNSLKSIINDVSGLTSTYNSSGFNSSNFTSNYSGFLGSFLSSFRATNFTSNYSGFRATNFTSNYSGFRATNFTSNYSGFRATNFTSNYSGFRATNFTSNYSSFRSSYNSSRSAFSPNFASFGFDRGYSSGYSSTNGVFNGTYRSTN